ncbi:uncharacterized protein EI90DRAFT_2542586 [Cantharellus anzutake]|uniref:uncharacterized protein n=1 Tax=Cantharellus anzutake TaxID=1750568 RepID=UPI0019061AA2|nr:uncharacterized protein EI90DRAFT_2542586 [Cantharellus anzutake]KAF8338114.1 hypothetical protein EI90DRAFT_2542586 [Cantharellus anzutake]
MSLNKSSSTRRASRSQQEQRRLSHPERLSQPSADSFDATLWNLNLASSASRSAQPPNSTTPLTTPEPVVGGTNTTSTTSQPSITIQYTLSSTSLLNTTVANPAGRILYIIDTKPRNRYDKILTCGWSKTSRTTISRVALAGVTEEIASVEWKVVRRDVVKFFGKREMDVDEFLPREPRSRRRFLDTTEGRWTWTNGKDGQFEVSLRALLIHTFPRYCAFSRPDCGPAGGGATMWSGNGNNVTHVYFFFLSRFFSAVTCVCARHIFVV